MAPGDDRIDGRDQIAILGNPQQRRIVADAEQHAARRRRPRAACAAAQKKRSMMSNSPMLKAVSPRRPSIESLSVFLRPQFLRRPIEHRVDEFVPVGSAELLRELHGLGKHDAIRQVGRRLQFMQPSHSTACSIGSSSRGGISEWRAMTASSASPFGCNRLQAARGNTRDPRAPPRHPPHIADACPARSAD
jgi:hypothetical protein